MYIRCVERGMSRSDADITGEKRAKLSRGTEDKRPEIPG